MQETEKIWMNGELVDWDDAKIHVGVARPALRHRASSRASAATTRRRGPAVFRLADHMQRLHNSARLLYMQIPYSVDELARRLNDLIGANGLPECYIRPIAFYGYGQLGVAARGNPVETVIMSWPWGTYLGEEALQNGIRTKISSWQRIAAERRPARLEGDRRLPQLDARGHRGAATPATTRRSCSPPRAPSPTARARRSSSSRDGMIYTPDLSTGILHGITRDSVIQIAQDLGYEVLEKTLIRSDLYLADEVFMCGTAAEVTPLRVGRRPRDRRRRRSRASSRRRTSTRCAAQTTAGRSGASSCRSSRAQREHRDQAASASARRGSTSATRSSCSRCCARAGSRSARRARASRRMLADAVGAPHCAAVSSGTAGCISACGSRASGPGDEVITSPYSFVASANCAIYEGATPVFADIDPRHVQPRPGRRRGGDHAADEGDRRGRHLRLPVPSSTSCARSATGTGSRSSRTRARRSAPRYKGRAARLARPSGGLGLLPEQADDDRRGRRSATRSSCSRCCARARSRSGRPGRASSRCSRTPSGRRTARRSPPGTAGLHLCMRLAGVGPGDEVITSPYSFVASANCAIYEGATPVFADIDPHTLNLDPAAVEAAITPRTKAIVAVDIFGYPCELDELRAICDRHGLALVEDACEALGARYKGRPLGSHGHPAVFAFYPNKQMTTGEGGAVTTGSARGARAARLAAQPGPARDLELAPARPARLQLPPRRHLGRARDRPAREARPDPRRRAARSRRATASCSPGSTSRCRSPTTPTTSARGSSTS